MRSALRTALSLVVMCVVGAIPALAQAPAPAMERLSFDQAVQHALDKNPTVAQAAAAIVRAEGLLQQARSATRPSVNANVTNVLLDSARGFNGGITQPQDQATFGLDVTMPVLAPARWAATAQARDQLGIAQLSAADVRRQIAVAVAQAYLAVINQQRQVAVNERARDNAKSHLTYADQRLSAGAGTRLNELRAAQELAADESRLENARLAVRRVQEALGVLLAAGGPIDAAGEPSLDAPAAVDEPTWLAARTDIRLFQAGQRAAQRVLADSPKDIWPTASASFDPQYVTPSGLFQPSKTWRLTFTFSQPIFQGGLNKAVEQQRRAAVTASTLALTAAEIQARSDVRLAQEAVRSNAVALASARTAADRAAEVLRITTLAFEAGASTNIEVIDAERSARDADTAVTIAEDALRRAQLDLLVALGRFPK